MKKYFGDPPTPLINPILTGKWVNLVKSIMQTRVPENWGAEQSVPRARTRERGPPSALAEIHLVPMA